MTNFTVSARKYRPGTFDTVLGQQHVTNTLKNAIKKNHLGHAFLFCGPRGVGKTTCARILAKALNCTNLTEDGEPCGTCPSCIAFNNQQSFNIYELDAASNNSVEDIRALNEQVRFGPQQGKYKIYIIDEVHMLSTAAFNAFLKTLEEPPAHAIFILATTERHKVLPTILSRCQVFDFHRITIKQMIVQLKEICTQENISAEDEAMRIIAQKADGAMRDALSIFDRIISFTGDKLTYKDVIENLHILDYEYYFKVTDLILEEDMAGALLVFDEILEYGFDGHSFLNGLSEHLRNLLVCKEPSTLKLLEVSENVVTRYMEQVNRAGLSFILSSLNILNNFDINFKTSKNQRLHVELALMKLCNLKNVLKMVGGEYATGEKKNSEPRQNIAQTSNSAAEKQTENGQGIVASPAKPSPVMPSSSSPSIGSGSLSLDKIKEQIAAKKTSEAVEKAIVVQEDFEAVSLEEFIKILESYSKELIAQGKRNLASAITKICEGGKMEMINGVATVKLDNDVLHSQFMDDKPKFYDYIKAIYKHRPVKVEYIVVAPTREEERKYLVSDKDKYERMKEINPDIAKIREILDLDIN